jgi:hypothetical protein
VTLDDFNQWLANFQQPVNQQVNDWLNGDFDYSGDITLDDFNQWLFVFQNNGGALGELEQAINAASLGSAERAMMAAAIQAVPEPTCLGVVAAAVGLLRRRRR